MQQLNSIENNDTLSVVGIERAIDNILRSQPKHLLNQLDIPCVYSRLPMTAQWKIRDAFFNKDLTHDTKVRFITDILTKLPPEQRYVPPRHVCRDDMKPKSKYYHSYNALTYKISFKFRLSELRNHLPYQDFEAIDDALRNESLSTDEKLELISKKLSLQNIDVLDKLFFTGIPIHDRVMKQRFWKLFFELPAGRNLYGSGRNGIPFEDQIFGSDNSTSSSITPPQMVSNRISTSNNEATTKRTPKAVKKIKDLKDKIFVDADSNFIAVIGRKKQEISADDNDLFDF